jgi:hypothetical protein
MNKGRFTEILSGGDRRPLGRAGEVILVSQRRITDVVREGRAAEQANEADEARSASGLRSLSPALDRRIVQFR